MDYSKLTPLLVEAVKAVRAETHMQLAERDARIDTLRAENAELRERVHSLETAVRKLIASSQGAAQ
jgi:hypothetical protein